MKNTPKYESKVFMGKIVLRDKILPSGEKVKIKDVEYAHPVYRQHEINMYAVGDNIATKVTNLKRKRTDAQNSFMHMYFTLIAIAHGHDVTMEDVKNWAKAKHLSKGITEVFGNRTRMVRGTSDLKVGEMIEFLARVECDSGIPMPDSTPFDFALTHDEFNDLKKKEIERYMAMKPELDGI